jgi:hypothetical protein
MNLIFFQLILAEFVIYSNLANLLNKLDHKKMYFSFLNGHENPNITQCCDLCEFSSPIILFEIFKDIKKDQDLYTHD